MNTTITTAKTKQNVVAMSWLVDYSGELVNEVRDEKRDASGKFLKLDCKLETAVKSHSFASQKLANKFGCEASDIFA